MKIFSLETKKHLAVWSAGLGLVVYFIDVVIYRMSSLSNCTSTVDDLACSKTLAIYFLLFFENEYLDMLFWILVSLIILSLARHFRKKKDQVPSKV